MFHRLARLNELATAALHTSLLGFECVGPKLFKLGLPPEDLWMPICCRGNQMRPGKFAPAETNLVARCPVCKWADGNREAVELAKAGKLRCCGCQGWAEVGYLAPRYLGMRPIRNEYSGTEWVLDKTGNWVRPESPPDPPEENARAGLDTGFRG